MRIELAETDAHIRSCYPVMRELRPYLESDAFLGIVRRLQQDGYALAFLEDAGQVVSVAGFRILRALFCDRFLYVDDMVTLSTARSKGYGGILLEWLKSRAVEQGCSQLHLDSAFHRVDAHRFYEQNEVPKSGFRFRAVLEDRVPWRT
jgi:GNAT superfamily N-acetyltransferase